LGNRQGGSEIAAREVVSRRLGDRTVVVNLRTNRIYELNRTASRLWELLESGTDRESAERALVEEFRADEATVRAEVDRLLVRLADVGIVNGHARD
jgi:Coenzyme PQQ synthesis protein D (PqqD)